MSVSVNKSGYKLRPTFKNLWKRNRRGVQRSQRFDMRAIHYINELDKLKLLPSSISACMLVQNYNTHDTSLAMLARKQRYTGWLGILEAKTSFTCHDYP